MLLAALLAGCETAADELSLDEAEVVLDAVNEVDLVSLGGDPGGPTQPIAVSVGATGTGGRLTSWKVGPGFAPTALTDSPLIPGKDHQLHVLRPRLSPKLGREMLVSASIVGGNLQIRTWSVSATGVFAPLATSTYNTVGVASYALEHRQIAGPTKKFQLVVPIVRATGHLRIATYEINGVTGAITPRADSGDRTAGAAADPQVSISFVPGGKRVQPHYAVSNLDGLGRIVNTAWKVNDLGAWTFVANYISGKDILNTSIVTRSASSLASAPLGLSGFVTAGNPAASQPDSATAEVQVWEGLDCTGATCVTPINLTDSSFDVSPGVFGVQQAAALGLVAPRAMSRDPIYGDDDLYPPKSPDSIQSIASVRKVMVLAIMLDAIAAGTADFDDVVTVSAAAAGNAGSTMNLEAGEQMTLRDLAYGMMIVSAGDATWAIQEHIGGTLAGSIALMNAKAAELDLEDTTYCHDVGDTGFSSVGYSTARDQSALWAAYHDHPEFLDIVGQASKTVCGTLADDSEKCHSLSKGMTWYVGLDGYKPGNGGGSCKSFATYAKCTACLTSQSTRLDRPVVNTSLATSGGSTTADAVTMFNRSFRQIFTPDYRGNSGGQGGAATDFGLDTVNDSYALTVVSATSMGVQVCNWNVNAGIGALTRTRCTTHGLAGLTVAAGATPRRVGIATLGTVEAEADYVFGRITSGALKLHLWRVGQKDF